MHKTIFSLAPQNASIYKDYFHVIQKVFSLKKYSPLGTQNFFLVQKILLQKRICFWTNDIHLAPKNCPNAPKSFLMHQRNFLKHQRVSFMHQRIFLKHQRISLCTKEFPYAPKSFLMHQRIFLMHQRVSFMHQRVSLCTKEFSLNQRILLIHDPSYKSWPSCPLLPASIEGNRTFCNQLFMLSSYNKQRSPSGQLSPLYFCYYEGAYYICTYYILL